MLSVRASTNCSGSCVDTQTSLGNCGACGTSCTTAPDKCHMTQGASCMAGSCKFPAKSCALVDCYSTPTCDPGTGDCVSTPLTGGTCGGNACYVNGSSGTCNAGVCVDGNGNPLQTTNCSTTETCKVGVCDHSGACTTRDVTNGTSCPSDLCVVGGTCQSGACTGTPKCTPMDECHEVSCDSSTGACTQAPSAKGKSCTVADDCQQNGACDGSGNCVGSNVPDRGTACTCSASCGSTAACLSGSCTCMDTGADMSVPPAGAPDLGTKPPSRGGCDYAGAPLSTSAFPLLLLVAALGLLSARGAAGSPVAGAHS